ncbi:MAG TPA: response regulator transcription factor, partial [Clostridia bacterium]
MIKVLIADDSVILRNGLKIIIEQDTNIEVVGCASDGMEALGLCKKLKPDIVLMDIRMPKCDGIEATRLIKEYSKDIKIIVLTTFDDEKYLSKVLHHGADGYILKEIGDDDLINTIKSTVNGFSIFQSHVVQNIRYKFGPNLRVNDEELVPLNVNLTERELSVIKLIVDGKDNREISKILCLTEGSVRNVVSSILDKLKLSDRTQLAVFA